MAELPEVLQEAFNRGLDNLRASNARRLNVIRLVATGGWMVVALVGGALFPARTDLRENSAAIGDTVNLASRIEGLTKEHGVPVLVSEATRVLAGERFRFTEAPGRRT